MIPFTFQTDGLRKDEEAAVVVQLDAAVSTREALFEQLASGLKVPDYFGWNWDALDEALRDLHWVQGKRVMFLHEGLPGLPDDALRIYLEILARAVEDWRRDPEHEIVVVFPADCEWRVRDLLKSADGNDG